MDEKVKNKEAGQANDDKQRDLDAGLEATFPASDPVSATRKPAADKADKDADKTENGKK